MYIRYLGHVRLKILTYVVIFTFSISVFSNFSRSLNLFETNLKQVQRE